MNSHCPKLSFSELINEMYLNTGDQINMDGMRDDIELTNRIWCSMAELWSTINTKRERRRGEGIAQLFNLFKVQQHFVFHFVIFYINDIS